MNENNSWFTAAWQQIGLDALNETVGTNPDLKNQMIEFLFDIKRWDRNKLKFANALTRFNACLNPNEPETFKNIDIWALMKRFDRHHYFLAMAADLGYEVRRVPTDERRQAALDRLAIAIEGATEEIALARAELAGIDQQGAVIKPHPAFRERGSFAFPEPADGGGF